MPDLIGKTWRGPRSGVNLAVQRRNDELAWFAMDDAGGSNLLTTWEAPFHTPAGSEDAVPQGGCCAEVEDEGGSCLLL